MMVINELYISMGCECEQWDNLCIIEMTAETCDYMSNILELIKRRGMPYWWLYLSKCKRCNEYWLIGQDHRINDIYCLYRLNPKQANDIIEKNNWPRVFDRFENLLKIANENNLSWSFCDPVNDSPLEYTIEDLALKRPFIKVSELSKLLNMDIETTLLLSNRVIKNNTSVRITLDV